MIGRLLALVGVVLMGFAIFGIVRSTQSIPGLGSVMSVATDAKAREAQLCKPGEKLEEDKGASQYTPGQGYGSSVTLYCVNNDRVKRDVTAEFANSMVGQVGGLFSGVMSSMMGSVIYFGLMGVGLVLTIIGLILGRRRTGTVSIGVPVTGSAGFTTYTTQASGGAMDLNQIIQQARDMKAAAGSGDLSTRLKQLEEARNAGLITESEYDRTRQQILDTIK